MLGAAVRPDPLSCNATSESFVGYAMVASIFSSNPYFERAVCDYFTLGSAAGADRTKNW
jgi:hypothetical protein